MNTFYELFIYFYIYSVIGWCVEMIYCRMGKGKWVDRGFLYGPYCPIYGFGGVIIITLLQPFSSSVILVFILGLLLTSVLEYITSFVMDKLFNAKWWDYSDYPLNINGRVCLLNSLLFGILGLILIYLVHPYVKIAVSYIPFEYMQYLVLVLVIFLSVDFTLTLNSLINFKDKLKELETIKEIKTNSKALSAKIEELVQSLVVQRINKSDRRFIKAFPNLKFNKLNNAYEELKLYIERQTQEYNERKMKRKKNKEN